MGSGPGRGTGIRAHAAHVGSNEGTSTSIIEEDKTGFPSLTADQWQRLVEMINKPNTNEKMAGNSLWIIDTGASNHMTGNLEGMSEIRDIVACPVGMPDGGQTNATKEGTVFLGGGLKLTNVLYVPKLNCSLISVSQLLDESNCFVQFTNKLCVMQDRTSKMLIGVGKHQDGLYYFHGKQMVKTCKANGMSQLELWHKRMGHPSYKTTQSVPDLSKRKYEGLSNKHCDVCLRAKQSRERFSISEHNASELFELIHCDLWGPYKTSSSYGAFYFMTIVDDYSRSVWIYLLANKKEVPRMLMSFFALVKRQFDKEVKIFRSVNGTEFLSMKNYFSEQGIFFQTSCVGTPQQNGRVECKHRHILNVARALRFQGNLPIKFWGECILTAGYLINRTASDILNGKTPYEMLHGKPPLFNHLRVFGCLCYAHNQKGKRDKLVVEAKSVYLLGIPVEKRVGNYLT